MKHKVLETRSALPLETRNDDPLAAATAAVEELRTAATAFETRQADALRAATDRLTALETRLARPGTQQEQTNEPAAETRAFGTYLRLGNNSPVEELRALTVSSDAQGGYLAPAEMSTEFIRDLAQVSPVRSVASVRQTGAPSVLYPKRTGITAAKWKGENQAQEASEPSFGQAEIVIRELNTYVDISNQLLADSAGQAEAEVRLALSEDFGLREGKSFVLGNGVLEPEGILINPDIAVRPNGSNSDLVTDSLIELLYSLPAVYRNASTWAMNGTTLGLIRTLRDGAGMYLWQPALQAGQPEMLLGRPVIELPDMPDLAANTTPIVVGDFTGYRVVDRVGLSVLVNPYLLATNGMTRVHATRRVGGGIIQAAKFRKLKMSAA